MFSKALLCYGTNFPRLSWQFAWKFFERFMSVCDLFRTRNAQKRSRTFMLYMMKNLRHLHKHVHGWKTKESLSFKKIMILSVTVPLSFLTSVSPSSWHYHPSLFITVLYINATWMIYNWFNFNQLNSNRLKGDFKIVINGDSRLQMI